MKTFFLIAPDNTLHELAPDRTLMIGRAGINHIILNDGAVSRVHAHVTVSADGPLLTDRDSANGTLVSGRAVKETVLKHGDTIQIGKFILYVFHGERQEAQAWLQNRLNKAKSDQTITDLNLNRLNPADLVGDLTTLSLINLLQTLVSQTQSGALDLNRQAQPIGRVFFTNGRIVHAETTTGLKGKEAFYELVSAADGQFIFRAGIHAPAFSILEPPSALILEACRRLDEKQAGSPPS